MDFLLKKIDILGAKPLDWLRRGAKPLVLPRARNFLYNSRDGFN